MARLGIRSHRQRLREPRAFGGITMRDNAQEIDEILERTVTDASSSDWQSTDYDSIKAEAKQAILDWHEQEIADYLSRIVKSADSEGRIWAETIHEQIKKLR